jgi:hypothetical protein
MPGPFSTGTDFESQIPRQRQAFWQRSSAMNTISSVNSSFKPEKTPESEKMGTLSGVFIPTTLNVMSILMYLRVRPKQPG